ncbi:MAG TPA: alkaline phosphatase family protein [Aeromicrobium sp.]|nr:alkaline phosphatase family protein [Aeromicrobium sp.]
MRHARPLLLIAVLVAVLASCQRQPGPAPPAPMHRPTLDKVLVVVIENKGFQRTRESAPRIRALGERYGIATDYRAITHPSRPNYYAMSAGATFGVDDSLTEVPGPTVLSEALRAGRTARVYLESMPKPCHAQNDGRYVARHNPWVLVRGEDADCRAHDLPLPAFGEDVDSGKLPNVGFLIPNNCNNAHSCPLSTADRWVSRQVARVMRGPDWEAGHLLIVLTADEDDRREDNRLFTALLNPRLSHMTVATPLDHYSLSRALAAFGHVPPLRSAANAPDLLREFGLAVRP